MFAAPTDEEVPATMEDVRRRAEQALRTMGRRGRTQRVPDDVRAAVLAYAREARSRGSTWAEVAEQLGLSASALVRWARKRPRRAAASKLVAVRVTEPVESRGALALVGPGGWRLEGLSLPEALEALRTLS